MDTYFKKEIIYPYKGIRFVFDVANELFSTFAIDHGTDMLLRHIVLVDPRTILDLGCGYGPIGICLAKTNPQTKVTMVDADLLAVRYADINIKKNNVDNVRVLGSVGVEAVVDQKFDVVVSNIPAKIGDKAIIEEFVLKPLSLLTPNGDLYVVIVSALNHLIPTLKGRYHLSVDLIRKRNGHFLYKINSKD
jgi:16S rRNA G1207 methylase RsmC